MAKMSSSTKEDLSDEEEEEQKQHKEASGGESHPRNLFKVAGVKNPAYWECVSYIAPNDEPKKWKASDAIVTYCTKCNKIIPYCSKKNPKAVRRHMEKYHADLLQSFINNDNKKRAESSEIGDFFPKEVKKVKVELVSKADQEHFTKLVA